MEDDKWDSENVRPDAKTDAVGLISNQWEGEDEDDDVKDCWDDPEEEDTGEKKEKEEGKVQVEPVKKPKKYAAKEESVEMRLIQTVDKLSAPKTPEEIEAEKLRLRKLEEDADLEVTKQLLGVVNEPSKELETKEEFDKYSEEIIRQVGSASKNQNFPGFLDNLIQQLCVHLSATDLKKIHTWIGNLQIEKNKMEQGTKSKKKGKTKAKLNLIDVDSDLYNDYTESDIFDDFM